MKKYIVVFLILSLILVFIPSCGLFVIPPATVQTDTKIDTDITEPEADTEADTEEFEPQIPVHAMPYYNTGRRYAWSTLNKEKRQLYYEVLVAALCRAEYVVLPDADTAEYIFACVIFDTPELFYVSETPKTEGGKLIFNYVFTLEQAEKTAKELDIAYNEFLQSEIKEEMTEYEKLKSLYEYIINNTRYDDEAEEKYDNNVFDERVNNAICAAGPLLYGKSICIGYARATQYLALRLGIQTFTVKGASTDEGTHYYNLVLLGDDYYYVDTTWGDPVDSEKGLDHLTYNYFCINTEELLRSHKIYTPVPLPVCTATEYNYFIYYGLTAETAEEIAEAAYEAYMRGDREVRLKVDHDKLEETAKGVRDAISKLFYEKGITEASFGVGRSDGPSTIYVKFK